VTPCVKTPNKNKRTVGIAGVIEHLLIYHASGPGLNPQYHKTTTTTKKNESEKNLERLKLISLIELNSEYIMIFYNSIKITQLKIVKNLNRHFSKEDI
jgi:hypothetical protein